MPQHNWYASGEWNAQCDQCGFVFKSSRIRKRWDGAMVCRECWEARHPQDFVKGIPDNQSVPWARDWSPNYVGQTAPENTVIGTHELGANPGGL